MSAFGQENNEEYLVHVIAFKHLLEQMGTVQDVGKAFQLVIEVRKHLELLLEAPKGETKAEKDEQRKALSVIKEDLKAAGKLAVAKTLKSYKRSIVLLLTRRKHNWTRLYTRCTPRNPWIGVNGQSHNGICMQSWLPFQDCIKLHKLAVFSADTAERQRFYMQQTIKKPQQVTVHQYMSCMGVLNDYLAYLPTVKDCSMAIEGTKKSNMPLDKADLAGIVKGTWYRSLG
jgi:hypothetical protein